MSYQNFIPSSSVESSRVPSAAEPRSCERVVAGIVESVEEADGAASGSAATGTSRRSAVSISMEEERELFQKMESVQAKAFAMLFARPEVGLFVCREAERLLEDVGEDADLRFRAVVKLKASKREAHLKLLPGLIADARSLCAQGDAGSRVSGALAAALAAFSFRLDAFEPWCKSVRKECCDEGLVGVARSVCALIREERKLLDCLLEAHRDFVGILVRKYVRPGDDVEALVQEGMAALLQAYYYFDPAHNVRLRTYSSHWIRQAVARTARTGRRGLHIPERSLKDLKAIKESQALLADKLGRNPSDAEIAKVTGLEPMVVRSLRQASMGISGLADPLGDADSDGCVGDSIGDESVVHGSEKLEGAESADALRDALCRLDARERKVLVWKCGLDGSEGISDAEIGRRIGVTRERVRVIAKGASRKLREILATCHEECFGCE